MNIVIVSCFVGSCFCIAVHFTVQSYIFHPKVSSCFSLLIHLEIAFLVFNATRCNLDCVIMLFTISVFKLILIVFNNIDMYSESCVIDLVT